MEPCRLPAEGRDAPLIDELAQAPADHHDARAPVHAGGAPVAALLPARAGRGLRVQSIVKSVSAKPLPSRACRSLAGGSGPMRSIPWARAARMIAGGAALDQVLARRQRSPGHALVHRLDPGGVVDGRTGGGHVHDQVGQVVVAGLALVDLVAVPEHAASAAAVRIRIVRADQPRSARREVLALPPAQPLAIAAVALAVVPLDPRAAQDLQLPQPGWCAVAVAVDSFQQDEAVRSDLDREGAALLSRSKIGFAAVACTFAAPDEAGSTPWGIGGCRCRSLPRWSGT